MEEIYLAPKEIAEELQIHEMTVLRWIRKGKLPSIKDGEGAATRYRVKRSDLDQLVKDIKPFLKSDARYSKNKKGK